MTHSKNYIHGKWIAGIRRKTFESCNPARPKEIVCLAVDSDPHDVDLAVEAAATAFPSWSQTPAPKRGEVLYRVAERLTHHKQALAETIVQEMGKVMPEALGDVQEAIDITYYMAGEGRRLSGETVPSELRNKDAKSLRVPVGVFALITPWNFPMAIPAWKIAPALIAGNTVILKPAEETPLCATRLVELFHEAGLPVGVLNMVHGFGESAGAPLVRHPKVNAISFTGSREVGIQLAGLSAGMGKPFAMETGGKNPIIIMDDADLEMAVEGALWGGFGTSGQRCTAASRLIVHAPIYDRFVKLFVEKARGLEVGAGGDKRTTVGPVISQAQYQKVLDYIEIGKEEGAKVVLGGGPARKGKNSGGYFIEPTIFVDVAPTLRIAQEEIFGPVVVIMKAGDLQEAITLANGIPFGLSSAIYTQNVNYAAIAERDLEAGLVYINASTIGAEVQLPFGGTKGTGLGPREAGGRGGALDFYTRWKVVYRDFSGRLQKAQID